MQAEELDIAAAASAVSDVTSMIEGMRSDEACKQQYDKARAMIEDMHTTFAGSDVSLSGGDDAPASLRSRKVPRRLLECVTDHFLAETPVTDL